LGYKLSNKSTLRFVFGSGTNVPTVTQLSNNVKMISKDIYYSGNPNLRNEHSYTSGLLYNFYSKYLDLELILSHLYKTSPIIGYYSEEGNHFIYNFYMIGGFVSRHGFLLLHTSLANTYKHTTDWGRCQGDEGIYSEERETNLSEFFRDILSIVFSL